MRIYDLRMADGSRHFGSLPESHDPQRPRWHALRDHVALLRGASITGFVTDHVTEAWIDFEYRGQRFAINNQHGDWWFFVTDPACPLPLLEDVLDHCQALLDPGAWHARRAGPMAPGTFRAVVHEPDGRISCHDFADASDARRHADDAASETESGIVLAYVVDDALRLIHRGRHYGGSP